MKCIHLDTSLMPKNVVWTMVMATFQSILMVCSMVVIIILMPIIISPHNFFHMIRRYNEPQWDFLRDSRFMKDEIIKSPVRMEMFDDIDVMSKIDFFSNFMEDFMKHMRISATIYLGLALIIILGLLLAYFSFYFRIMIILVVSMLIFIAYMGLLLWLGGPTSRFNADVIKVIAAKTTKLRYSLCETCKDNKTGWSDADRQLFEMSRFNCCGWMKYSDVSNEKVGTLITPFCCKNYSWFSIDWQSRNQLIIPLINRKRINITQKRCPIKDSKPGCFYTLQKIWMAHYPLVFSLYRALDFTLYLSAILIPCFAISIIMICIQLLCVPSETSETEENMKMNEQDELNKCKA